MGIEGALYNFYQTHLFGICQLSINVQIYSKLRIFAILLLRRQCFMLTVIIRPLWSISAIAADTWK